MVNFTAIGAFITALATGLFLFSSIFFRNKSQSYYILGLMNLPFFIWTLGFGIWQYSTRPETALFFLKFLMVGVCIMPPIFVLCVFYLAQKNGIWGKIFLWVNILISCAFFYLICFFKYFFVDFYRIHYIGDLYFDYWPKASIYFSGFMIWFSLVISICLIILWRNVLSLRGSEKEKNRYYLIGTVISFISGLTVILPWYGINFLPIGFLFITAYPISIFYSSARYRFINIQLVVGRGLIYLASLITIVGFAFLLYGGNYLAGRYVPEQFIWPIIVALGLMVYPAVFSFYEHIAAKFFYYSFYSYQKLLADLGKKLGKVLDLKKLSKLFLDTVIDVMKLEKAALALKEDDVFVLEGNQGFDKAKLKNIFANTLLTDYVQGTLKPFSQEEIESLTHVLRHEPKEQEKVRQIGQSMKDLGVSLIIPMYMEDRLTGLLFLGERLSGAHFSEQDVDTLSDLALQASVAFENARNYSTTKKFTEKLEDEVKERTKQLRATNEKLKDLDKEKSDFVALASYHLRTPLTVIKSYVSSVLEGKSEPIAPEMQKPLKIVYDANERLIQFTNELLDVERIESGKIEIKTEPVSLQEMIKTIVAQLSQRASEKNLEFKFNNPVETLPNVNADKLKLEQVVYNVIDNALKYTMKGSVIVDLKKQGSKQVIEVSDTGEGMTAEEQANIFGKFTRGESGKKMYVKGSGIGLYIAKKFLEMHKGKIWAQSRGEGLGSTFYIEIPEQ